VTGARVASGRVTPAVAVVDTGSGNLRSVEKALALVGADVVVTADADRVARADKIVVPGQGAFGGHDQVRPAADDAVPQLLALRPQLLAPQIGNPGHSRTIATTGKRPVVPPLEPRSSS